MSMCFTRVKCSTATNGCSSIEHNGLDPSTQICLLNCSNNTKRMERCFSLAIRDCLVILMFRWHKDEAAPICISSVCRLERAACKRSHS